MAFAEQLKIALAGLEKDLYLPFPYTPMISSSERAGLVQIKAIQSFLFFFLRTHTIFAGHYIYRKQIFAATAALLADAKDLIDGEPFSLVLIVYGDSFLS